MRALVCVLLTGVALAAEPGSAPNSGQIAIVPFSGLHADEPQLVVVRMLKRRAQLVPALDVGKTSALVIISGTIEHPEGKLQLVVSALSVKSGDVLDQLMFAIPKTRHLDRDQLKQLAMQVNELANKALKRVEGESAPIEPAPGEDEANAAVEAAVAQSGDTERVPMDISSLSQAQLRAVPHGPSVLPPRPRWAPLLDGEVGVIVAARSVSFKPALTPNYKPGSGSGIHADLTLYPLAYTYDRWQGALSGLGAGVTLDVPFWPDTQSQADNPGAPNGFNTQELRAEGGVRWKFTLRRGIPRFDLTALLGAGMHKFFIARVPDGSSGYFDVGPPNVSYVFGAFGVQARLHVREWGSAWVAFSYEYVPDAGHIEDVAEYGYSSTWGLHLRGGFDVYLWRGLHAGVSAYWERFALDFTHKSPMPYKAASSAVDNYYGGIISIGYTL